MADSAGKGILIVAVCHGLAQLEARWDEAGAQAIWNTAGIKVILGGVADTDTLDRLSRLCGEVALRTHTWTRDRDGKRTRTVVYQPVRILPPELLRTLPEWRALVVRGNLSPVVVRLRMAWRRWDYRCTARKARVLWGPEWVADGRIPAERSSPAGRNDLAAPHDRALPRPGEAEPVTLDELITLDPADGPWATEGREGAEEEHPQLSPDKVTPPRPRRPWDPQREHTAVLHDLTDLRQQVEQILATLTEEDDDTPTTWFWLTMSDQERDEKFAELRDWVETVLRVQYPGYLADHIRPCWPNHPEARWELAWLYHLWSGAYLADQRMPRDAAEWHDRWLPGTAHRLRRVMNRCEQVCQRPCSDE